MKRTQSMQVGRVSQATVNSRRTNKPVECLFVPLGIRPDRNSNDQLSAALRQYEDQWGLKHVPWKRSDCRCASEEVACQKCHQEIHHALHCKCHFFRSKSTTVPGAGVQLDFGYVKFKMAVANLWVKFEDTKKMGEVSQPMYR